MFSPPPVKFFLEPFIISFQTFEVLDFSLFLPEKNLEAAVKRSDCNLFFWTLNIYLKSSRAIGSQVTSSDKSNRKYKKHLTAYRKFFFLFFWAADEKTHYSEVKLYTILVEVNDFLFNKIWGQLLMAETFLNGHVYSLQRTDVQKYSL